jgi:hypothetical protein
VVESLFSPRENRPFIRKKALKMNHKDVRSAEKPVKTKGEVIQALMQAIGRPIKILEAADGKRLPSIIFEIEYQLI